MGYICANFGLPRPLCSPLRPDVRDKRQTDVRQTDRRQTKALLNARDVRNRFLSFCSVSVRFLKETRIRFGMNLFRFGLQKLGSVRIVIY